MKSISWINTPLLMVRLSMHCPVQFLLLLRWIIVVILLGLIKIVSRIRTVVLPMIRCILLWEIWRVVVIIVLVSVVVVITGTTSLVTASASATETSTPNTTLVPTLTTTSTSIATTTTILVHVVAAVWIVETLVPSMCTIMLLA